MSDKNIEMAVKIARLTAERGGAAYDLGAMLTMHIEQDSKKRLG